MLWYVANLATKLGFDLNEIAEAEPGEGQGSVGAADRTARRSARLRRRVSRRTSGCRGGSRVLIKTGSRAERQADRPGLRRRRSRSAITSRTTPTSATGTASTTRSTSLSRRCSGWSPITRWLLNRKRKSRPEVDEVEDGAARRRRRRRSRCSCSATRRNTTGWKATRASARRCCGRFDWMANGLEASRCTSGEWEDAIIQGFAAWRFIHKHQGGVARSDLDRRTITASLPEPEMDSILNGDGAGERDVFGVADADEPAGDAEGVGDAHASPPSGRSRVGRSPCVVS